MEYLPPEQPEEETSQKRSVKMTAEQFEQFRIDVAKKIQLAEQRAQPAMQRSTTRRLGHKGIQRTSNFVMRNKRRDR